MAPTLDKVDAPRQRNTRIYRKDCYLHKYIATPLFLGRFGRAFLCDLSPLFHGYLAAVLSGSGTPPLHAKHGMDCKRLLSGGCCVGDYEWLAFGFLDPQELYAYLGAQDGNGNRLWDG